MQPSSATKEETSTTAIVINPSFGTAIAPVESSFPIQHQKIPTIPKIQVVPTRILQILLFRTEQGGTTDCCLTLIHFKSLYSKLEIHDTTNKNS